MESQPQNPEIRNNPEKVHPCIYKVIIEFLGPCLATPQIGSYNLRNKEIGKLHTTWRYSD